MVPSTGRVVADALYKVNTIPSVSQKDLAHGDDLSNRTMVHKKVG